MSKIQGSAFIQPIRDGTGELANSTLQATQQTTLSSIDTRLIGVATTAKQDEIVTAIEGINNQKYVWTIETIVPAETITTEVGVIESSVIDLGNSYNHNVKPFYTIQVNNDCNIDVQLLGSIDGDVEPFYPLDQKYSELFDTTPGTPVGRMYSLNDIAVPRFYKLQLTINNTDTSNQVEVIVNHGAWKNPVDSNNP